MRGDEDIEALLGRIVEGLRAGLGDRLVALALFGSVARGQAGPDSDLDLLVIARELPRPWDRGAFVRRHLPPRPLVPAVSLLIRAPEEFDRDVRPLYLDLALDARVLFERDEWLSSRLARLRELLRQARLRRRPDLFWEWEERPTRRDWSITWQGVVR